MLSHPIIFRRCVQGCGTGNPTPPLRGTQRKRVLQKPNTCRPRFLFPSREGILYHSAEPGTLPSGEGAGMSKAQAPAARRACREPPFSLKTVVRDDKAKRDRACRRRSNGGRPPKQTIHYASGAVGVGAALVVRAHRWGTGGPWQGMRGVYLAPHPPQERTQKGGPGHNPCRLP